MVSQMLAAWQPGELYDEQRPAPRILAQRRTQTRPLVTVRLTPSETGTLYYHWYRDGQWVTRTCVPELTQYLDGGAQVELAVCVTRYRDWDGRAHEPPGYPRQRPVQWLRTLASDVAGYLIQSATGQGAPAEEDWNTLGRVRDDGSWFYLLDSPVLSGQSWYWFGIVPVDKAGNSGTRLELGPYWQVGRPTMPDVAVSFDDETQKITVSEA